MNNISKKVKQSVIIGLAGLALIISVGVAANIIHSIGYNLGCFHAHVYDYAKTHKEKDIKEKEFYNKTGIDVNHMSIFDKYVYGRSLTKGYIK